MNAAPPAAEQAATLAHLSCLADYETAARQRLSPAVWAYLDGAAADGLTARANRAAFAQQALLPRVLRSAGGGHTMLTLHGQSYAHPIFIAPTAYHRLAHPDGERATAVAAAALHAPYVISTQASVELEDIARAPHGPLWFQLYGQAERRVTLDLLRRAEAVGCQAIVLTVDAPIQGLRNDEQRHGFRLPPAVQAANLLRYADATPTPASLAAGEALFAHPLVTHMSTWDDLAWLVRQTALPVWVKGLLHPADVAPALDAGAAGIVVSNHGGRALDGVPATLHALPAIAATVAGRVPLLLDGGVRRGSDVFKALALGAAAVLVGRPILHGLAVAGATGVAHVLNLLRSELEATMILAGCPTLAAIGPAALFPAHSCAQAETGAGTIDIGP